MTEPRVKFDTSWLRFVTSGYIVDEISRLGYGGAVDGGPLLQSLTDRNAHGTAKGVFEAVWLRLVADQDFGGTKEALKSRIHI